MNSSAGMALRLALLAVVVFGMPLLAIPLGWDVPASGERFAPPRQYEESGEERPRGVVDGERDGVESVELAQLALSSSLQRRLEELGAEYLVVERLEVSGLYRCVCLVDVPGTAYRRPFEAADIQPERALQRVLDELTAWRLAMHGLTAGGSEAAERSR